MVKFPINSAVIIFFLVRLAAASVTKCDVSNTEDLSYEKFLAKLTNSSCYDRLVRPNQPTPFPVQIKIELSHIETKNQVQFKTHLVVQYSYNDDRLNYSASAPDRGSLSGQVTLRLAIWIPHIIIKNEKDTTIMGADGLDVYVTISPNGDVVYTKRIITTSFCWMNLQKFPFDTQSCYLRLDSWAYNASDLELYWDESGAIIVEDLHLTEFDIASYSTSKTTIKSSYINSAISGNFSELVLQFDLIREVGYYVMIYYLPSVLLVITSWVTFWLQADAGPPRATLGTSTMLAFITLNGSLISNLPKVSYIKASDIWFVVCSVFIFGSLAEFAFVNVIWRRKKTVELKKPNSKHIIKGAFTPSLARRDLRKAESTLSLDHSSKFGSFRSLDNIPRALDRSDSAISDTTSVRSVVVRIEPDGVHSPTIAIEKPMWHSMTPQEVAIWVDRKSRIVFPVCFAIFNILYWICVSVL